MSKRMAGVLLTLALLVGVNYGAYASEQRRDDGGSTVLEFKTMAGVSRPYTGAANAIRGVPGGGLPWVLSSAKGELKDTGKLEIKIRGLVFDPNDPVVISRGIGNTNTVAQLKAIVSCQTVDAAGAAVVANVSTELFPATTGALADGAGNADIETTVALPTPCIAPIVFVTSPTGSWFASTGR